MSSSFANDIMQLIQLESGDYRLEIEVEYQSPGEKIARTQNVSRSAIEFTVQEDFREIYKIKLQQYASVVIYNKLFNRNDPVIFPVYQPYQIREI